jgi:xylulokinase
MGAKTLKILCADVGTSALKGGILSSSGRLLEWGRVPLLAGDAPGAAEWDAEHWISAFRHLLDGFSLKSEISGLVISGNGPTIVPLDASGKPAGHALLWLDKREMRIPEESSFYLPKAAWLKNNNPKIYEKTDVFLPCPEYIAFVLSGERSAVVPSSEFIPYLWTADAIGTYGLDTEKFPPLVMTGEVIGSTQPVISEELGIPAGVPIFAGGSDFQMALLGTGCVVPGRTCDRAGTSEGINHCSTLPLHTPRLRTLPHVIEGYYNVAGILSSTGRIFEWFRKISGQQRTSYKKMLEAIARLPFDHGRPMFLPSLHIGETWDFEGGAFMQLEPEHGIDEMGRAVVESIGFSIRNLLETMEVNGCRISEIRVSGGQARNPAWNQMKADITGHRIDVPKVIDAELVGGTISALVGKGEFGGFREAADELVRIQRIFEPRREQFDRFSNAYEYYQGECARIVRAIPPE